MAHTDHDERSPRPEPAAIIPQKPPPPPPGRQRELVDDPAGTPPERPERRVPPIEAPPSQPIAPRDAHGINPPSSRRHRKPSGHIVIPAPTLDPVVIDRAGGRAMKSAPLILIDFPRDRPRAASIYR